MDDKVKEFQDLTKKNTELTSSISTLKGKLEVMDKQVKDIFKKYAVKNVREFEEKFASVEKALTEEIELIKKYQEEVAPRVDNINAILSNLGRV